jgi:hypothetical protein
MHIHAAVGGRKGQRVTINTIARQLDRFFLSTPTQLPRFSPFLFLLFAFLVAVMARSTLSALVALASFTLVASQSTTAPAQTAANGVPTFPATPLVSELFPYTALVRIFSR